MEFYDHRSTLYDMRNRKDSSIDAFEFYNRFISHLSTKKAANESQRCDKDSMLHHAGMELQWYKQTRPYYKLYPSIIPALLRVKLDTPCDRLDLGSKTVCIRLPHGFELKAGSVFVRTLLVRVGSPPEMPETTLIISETLSNGFAQASPPLRFKKGRTLESFVAGNALESVELDSGDFRLGLSVPPPEVVSEMISPEFLSVTLRLCVAVLLLANDPSIVTPDVISKYADEYERTSDESKKQAIVDRSIRRGKVGWNIGKEYETCPHFRRPHFAIRHTGKGGTVPKIVPVKGSVVHSSKVSRVPTGYILPDGNEVEPE